MSNQNSFLRQYDFWQTLPTKERDAAIASYFGGNNWIKVPIGFQAAMPTELGMTLSFLINRSEYQNANERSKGWFTCPLVELMSNLFCTQQTCGKRIRSLCDAGYITTKRIGWAKKRYFKIRYDTVAEAVRIGIIEWHEKHDAYLKKKRPKGDDIPDDDLENDP